MSGHFSTVNLPKTFHCLPQHPIVASITSRFSLCFEKTHIDLRYFYVGTMNHYGPFCLHCIFRSQQFNPKFLTLLFHDFLFSTSPWPLSILCHLLGALLTPQEIWVEHCWRKHTLSSIHTSTVTLQLLLSTLHHFKYQFHVREPLSMCIHATKNWSIRYPSHTNVFSWINEEPQKRLRTLNSK